MRSNGRVSASPKPHPSKPHPCNMPQAKTEVALQFLECCAAEVALQHWLFCSAEVILTKSCAAASEKLHCNIEKAALQLSGAFLPLSCGFQAPTFRHPRLGPAEGWSVEIGRDPRRLNFLRTPWSAVGVSRALWAQSVPGSVPKSVPEMGGVRGSVPQEVQNLSPECPARIVRDTFLTLRGRSRDTFLTPERPRGNGTLSRTPPFRRTLGPQGPERPLWLVGGITRLKTERRKYGNAIPWRRSWRSSSELSGPFCLETPHFFHV